VLVQAPRNQRALIERIERLFESFRRLRPDRLDSERGHHGLELSIVRATAAAHGAALNSAPGPDGGLAVTVTFPTPAPEPPA
jgi:signal transduction histidine kinase